MPKKATFLPFAMPTVFLFIYLFFKTEKIKRNRASDLKASIRGVGKVKAPALERQGGPGGGK